MVALNIFHALGKGIVNVGRRRMTFQQLYDRRIDTRYADSFITRLMALEDLDTEADALLQETALTILAVLEREGLYHEEVAGSEYLAAYCLYWWTAFARGYRFELSIFRDLEASGIAFLAHDLRNRKERRSPYDLVVMRQLGDIKNTTYFLQTAATQPLRCDFYVTRLYDSRRRRYVPVVLMTEAAWRLWDGDVMAASLETAANLFPQPVKFVFGGHPFVMVLYELWKDKVKRKQPGET